MTERINPYMLFLGAFVPNWLLRRPEVSQGAKLTYARLCQYAGKDGEAFPAQETLALEIGGISARHVRRYLKELCDMELLEAVRRGLGQSNSYYFLHHPWMMEFPDSTEADRKDMSGPQGSDRTRMSSLRGHGSPTKRISEEKSSEEEEDQAFLVELTAHYFDPPPHTQPHITSPDQYFRAVRDKGDRIPRVDLDLVTQAVASLIEAASGIPQYSGADFLYVGPTLLPGLVTAGIAIQAHNLTPDHLRAALYLFCQSDGDENPALSPADILPRIAKRPDLFVEALMQHTLAVG